MSTVRMPAVAGMFYPADAHQLQSAVTGYLADAPGGAKAPKAIIAPHAGYIYSGPVAASAYAWLASARDRIRRVVLLGPSHRVPLFGMAYSTALEFMTPLGKVPVDHAAIAAIADLPKVKAMDQAHGLEHSLEVHLPFLQTVLSHFSLVPLVVGDASAEEVCAVLDRLWGGDETLIVVSSDLSHYHDYATAQRMDRHTSALIEALRGDQLHYDDACGRVPVSGLLLCAQRHGLTARTVDLRNSGDTAGPRDQVVGYGAYLFH